jgi:diazepam-binding inhibitor (GABA receptor modulating acyl-CoA-binding protein)
MSLNEEFEKAVEDSRKLTSRPDNETLLELYALYKQAVEGDVTGERPGGFDFKAIAKYDAWASKKSMAREDAMRAYIALVQRLSQQAG